MTQSIILGSDYVKAALKTKVNNNFTETYDDIATNEDDIDTNTAAIAVNTAAIAALASAVASIAAGSGARVSANDTTIGDLNGKLVEAENIVFAENNDGGSETLSISAKETIITKTADYTILTSDLNGLKTFNNYGAIAPIELTLPPGFTNAKTSFFLGAAQYLKVTAAGIEKFRYRTVQGAEGGYVRSNVIGTFWSIWWSGAEWLISNLTNNLKYDL